MEAPRPLSRSRRRLARDLAHGLGLGALILALLGPAAAPAWAAAGPGVLVSGPGGAQGFVTEAAIRAATPAESTIYLLRATAGEAGTPTPRRGMPVLAALEASGVPLAGAGYLTVPRPDGSAAYLPMADLAEPSPAFEGGKPALVSIDATSTRFFRPLIAANPNDVNATDNIATVSGEALALGVHRGDILEVHASASPPSTRSGTPVQLTATAAGGLPGESFAYAWNFGDGTGAAGAATSHTFTGSGTFTVRVTVTGTDESGGEATIPIVVGTPPTTQEPSASPIPTPKPKEHQKPPKPPTSPAKPHEAPHNKRPSSTKTPRRTPEPSSPTASPPAPEPSPAEPVAQPAAAPSAGGSPEPPRCCSAEPPPDGSSHANRSKGPHPQGELVEGTLVGDRLSPAELAAATASEPGASSSSPGAVSNGGSGAAPLGALIVLALLSAGALFEWRRSRPAD
ncbi:MAG: PKD domain-containing protein [Actinobacteria bacterium]|nr:PKD domain-containing protein [Actinomycetota bacterium]